VPPSSVVLLKSFGSDAGSILCIGTEKHPHAVRSHVASNGIHHVKDTSREDTLKCWSFPAICLHYT